MVWHSVHPMLKTLPDLETCRPSWQRKHPGQFRCPMLELYVFQFTFISGKTLRSKMAIAWATVLSTSALRSWITEGYFLR